MFDIRCRRASPMLLAIGLACAAGSPSAGEGLTVASGFGHNMVLQRDQPLPVRGTAAPDTAVTVAFADQQVETRTAADGRWTATLAPLAASAEGRVLTVAATEAAGPAMVFTNVVVGEVWLGSGQSNMQWPLDRSLDGKAAAAAADDPLIRVLAVPAHVSHTPLASVALPDWQACTGSVAAARSAVAYYFAHALRRELDVPVGIIQAAWGGTAIEPWTAPEGFPFGPDDIVMPAADALDAPPTLNQPQRIYNAMIHPLAGHAIRGVLWYQGESNAADGLRYAARLRALILGWRAVWANPDLPFLVVQIAPYFGYAGENLQLLWMAQEQVARTLPGVALATTTDLGDPGDIHPVRKREVGERLARLALHGLYARTALPPGGPVFRAATPEPGRLRIHLDHAEGLRLTDAGAPGDFAVAGADAFYAPAAMVLDNGTLLLSSPAVPVPQAARFGWARQPATNIVNATGIPLRPFVTDEAALEAAARLARRVTLQELVVEPGPLWVQAPIAAGPEPLVLDYRWHTGGTAWIMDPPAGTLTVPAGEPEELVTLALVGRGQLEPLPVLAVAAEIGGRRVGLTLPLAYRIRRGTFVGPDGQYGPASAGFVHPRSGAPADPDTAFMVAAGPEALRVRVIAHEPAPDALRATVTAQDGPVWTDDSIDLFLQPADYPEAPYFHFIANSRGVRYDGLGGPGRGAYGDPAWNGEWEAAATVEEDAYIVEFTIPYATLGTARPPVGAIWGLNVCRTRPSARDGAPQELSAWSRTGGSFHMPTHFGRLNF